MKKNVENMIYFLLFLVVVFQLVYKYSHAAGATLRESIYLSYVVCE